MPEIKQRAKNTATVVTVDGAQFHGELIESNKNGFYLRVENRTERERFVFISHQAVSHLEIEGF